nr:MAG TPA: hypothetical protein [Herelleviridae sp.]
MKKYGGIMETAGRWPSFFRFPKYRHCSQIKQNE